MSTDTFFISIGLFSLVTSKCPPVWEKNISQVYSSTEENSPGDRGWDGRPRKTGLLVEVYSVTEENSTEDEWDRRPYKMDGGCSSGLLGVKKAPRKVFRTFAVLFGALS